MARKEIDPQLPYIQVHRSVAGKAAQIAQAMGLSPQHVRGALDCLWEGLADRRLLTGKSEMVLDEADLKGRLFLAFGVQVEFNLLVSAGFLEPRENGWRVRGMSRYLEAETKRQKIADSCRNKGKPKKKSVQLKSSSTEPELNLSPGSAPQSLEFRVKSLKEEEVVAASRSADAEPTTPPDPNPKAATRRARKKRTPSEAEALRDAFMAHRALVLGEGIAPDTGWSNARTNRDLAPLLEFDRTLLLEAHAEFLEARSECDPPSPLHFFVTDLGRYLSRAQKRREVAEPDPPPQELTFSADEEFSASEATCV